MGVGDRPLAGVEVVTADRDLFEVVRFWAAGDLRDFAWDGADAAARTLLVATPAPWRLLVAVAQQHGGVLRSVLVVKNAVALWPLRHELVEAGTDEVLAGGAAPVPDPQPGAGWSARSAGRRGRGPPAGEADSRPTPVRICYRWGTPARDMLALEPCRQE